MTDKDPFDDHEGFQSAFGKIASAMEQGRDGLRHRGPMIGVLTAAVALFVLFAVFWSTYPRGGSGDAPAGPVPLVRADAAPFKTAPDDPGGMDIPYRDSTVFETLRSANRNNNGSRVESLLPAPEEPISREQMFAGLKTDPIAEPPVEDPAPEIAAAPEAKPEPEPAAPVAAPRAPEKADTVVEKAVRTEPAAGNEKDRSDQPGTHYIQLGSVKDRAAAEVEWGKLKKEFPRELGGLTMRIQDVTLPDRGTFYRIQGGAVAQTRAKEICGAISAKRSGGCLVVAR